MVNVKAQPGFKFRGWSGDLNGTSPTVTLPMNSPHSIEAKFEKVPFISPTGVGNAAGSTPQSGVAPGSIVTISGASLVNDPVTGPDSPLAQTLGGLTVMVAGRLMPMFSVTPSLITMQLAPDMAEGNQTLIVNSIGQAPVKADFTVVRNAPGLFSQTVNGQAFAMAAHADGSLVTTDSPATQGELLTVYGTGFGPTTPQRPEGFAVPADPPFALVDSATVLLADSPITPEAAFAVPGKNGLDAVRFRISDSTGSGTNASLHVTVNGQDSNVVLLPVK